VVLVDESRAGVNKKLELWRRTLDRVMTPGRLDLDLDWSD
jgi:hypothetical protein